MDRETLLRHIENCSAAKEDAIQRVIEEKGISLDEAKARCLIEEFPGMSKGGFVVDGVRVLEWGYLDRDRPTVWILNDLRHQPTTNETRE